MEEARHWRETNKGRRGQGQSQVRAFVGSVCDVSKTPLHGGVLAFRTLRRPVSLAFCRECKPAQILILILTGHKPEASSPSCAACCAACS